MTVNEQALPDNPVLYWLWRTVWLLLAAALLFAIGGGLLLNAGLADPPHAGPLVWQDTLPEQVLKPQTVELRRMSHNLPSLPFTLEVAARFSPESDSSAYWSFQFCATGTAQPPGLYVFGDRTFSLDGFGPAPVVREGFPHLRPPGQVNQLTLDIGAFGVATLRLNDEIAWQGRFGLPGSCWALSGRGGRSSGARLTWEWIALYAP